MTDLGEGPGPPGLRLIFGSDYGGRKGIGNLNIRQKRKQQLCKCIMLFCAFLCRPVHHYDVKSPNFTFYGKRKRTAEKIYLPFET